VIFTTEIKKSNQKFSWRHTRLQIVKAILSKKTTTGSIKIYYRAITIKTVWQWHKNRYVDQWNSIENPDMNTHSYVYLLCDKGAQNIKWEKIASTTNVAWKTGYMDAGN
jgi:acetoin utilization deacetylase AcuC-like enzyme